MSDMGSEIAKSLLKGAMIVAACGIIFGLSKYAIYYCVINNISIF